MELRELFISLLIFIFFNVHGQNADHSVFQVSNSKNRQWLAYKNNDQLLYSTISDEVFRLLKERENRIGELKTKEDWERYRHDIKAKIFSSLNRLKKTPLNAQITGVIKKDDFRIEKILFESHPGFYVTGCLFIPKKRQRPAPAVIYVSGHSALAFRSKTYQHIIINLVKKGFVVFAIDPVGQGERLQYVDEKTNKSKIGGPTTEHSYAGAQTLLTGTSLSDYFIWDGVRAVDYLATRKEVDMKRIGLTGRSGGGTQTAMIAAYDDRILAAAPECYITNFKRLFQSIGPQDAEQNMYHAIKKGFDFPDYLHLRAPKPSLIVTTTLDFFSQQGARETYAEAKRSYKAMGASENISMVEDFGVHESTKRNREAVYVFFQKYLDVPGDSVDRREVEVFEPEELWVTKTGQVGTSLNSKTIFDLNREYFNKIKVPEDDLKEVIKKISGVEFNLKLTSAVFTGKLPGEKYDVSKYFLENNSNRFALPVWVVKAHGRSASGIMVWLRPEGKESILNEKMLSEFLNKGYVVVAADMPGTGELFDREFKGDGFVKNVPFNYTFGAQLAGKSIPGILADHIDLLMQFVAEMNRARVPVDAFIEREMNSPFLHFTAFNDPFSKIVLLNPLLSNRSLINEKFYDPQLAYYVVPGSLPYYDFSGLTSLLPDGSCKIINPVDTTDVSRLSETDEVEIINFFQNTLP